MKKKPIILKDFELLGDYLISPTLPERIELAESDIDEASASLQESLTKDDTIDE